MTHKNTNIQIIAFVGLAGAGKSSAVDYLRDKQFPSVYFGGVILDAMTEAGLEHTEENEKRFREEIREREGKDFVVKRIITQIRSLIEAGQRQIIADGLYTWSEYRMLKREFPGELTVIGIVAPRKLRHRRLSQRPIRPLTEQQATERDWAEIENLEKGGPIAVADHFVINDGTIEDLHQKLDAILIDEIRFCKAPMQC
ncbi:dephospho-CoA kinase [Candidatus Saccharibacteria bacterium 32-49-12]|nr:MAG: dephospho-CoA kinase [Candidatus Saccharibacteria bacterium 32-49-12]